MSITTDPGEKAPLERRDIPRQADGWTGLETFLARVSAPEMVDWCATRVGARPDDVAALINTYAGEVPIALSLLDGVDLTGRHILDVGAGIGLASFYLRDRGFDVTALEPGGIGFEINKSLFVALRERLECPEVKLLPIGAEELDPARHGVFDAIFSVNVLEHVADLEAVVNAIARVLAPGGVMVHTCPNYAVPYEPHYGITLLPFAPRATPWAGARRTEDLWRSLNFITVKRLCRAMRQAGLKPDFEAGIMARSLERLLKDPVFAARHGPLLGRLARLLATTGAITLVRGWPPSLATPLVVRAAKASQASKLEPQNF